MFDKQSTQTKGSSNNIQKHEDDQQHHKFNIEKMSPAKDHLNG